MGSLQLQQKPGAVLNEAAGRTFSGRCWGLGLAEWQGLMSSEHLTVDGTLIEAWASMRSFKAKDGSESAPPWKEPGLRAELEVESDA